MQNGQSLIASGMRVSSFLAWPDTFQRKTTLCPGKTGIHQGNAAKVPSLASRMVCSRVCLQIRRYCLGKRGGASSDKGGS